MEKIFEYMDYRKYLADYYNEQKEKFPNFSYQYFAGKAGFKAKDFFCRVIHGQKNLSLESIHLISKVIGLSKKEREYFENLVGFNQAKHHEERKKYFDRLAEIGKEVKGFHHVQIIPHEQYKLYSEWYHVAVRSIIDMYPFYGDYEWLARKVHPAITVSQAKKSIALLEEFGLIHRKEDGQYEVTEKAIATGDDVKRHALHHFYLTGMKLAGDAMDKIPREKRNITGVTVGISEETYQLIADKITEFRKDIARLANQDPKADRVYQMNIQLFPLSQIE